MVLVRRGSVADGEKRGSETAAGQTAGGGGGDHASRGGLAKQFICTAVMSQNHTLMGTSVAFSSYIFTELSRPDAELRLSPGQLAWVGSAFFLGTLAGFVLSGQLGSRLGVRELVLGTAPLALAGWLLIGLGPSLAYLICGRVLTGLNQGLTGGPVKNHVGEISSVKYRGSLLSLCNSFVSVGMLLGYGMAALLPWRTATLVVGLVPLAIQVVGVLPFPNSGKWLITHGRPEAAARSSIRFYQGSKCDVDEQVKLVKLSLGDSHKHNPSTRELVQRLLLPHHLRPMLLVLGQLTFFMFTGGFAVSANASVIFGRTSGGPYRGAVIVSAVRVFCSLLVTWVLEKFSRTRLLAVCAALEGLGCLLTGAYFFWQQQLVEHDWMVMVGLLILLVTYSMGVSPITWVQLSELLPNAIRAPASSICLAYFGLTNFVLIYAYPLLVEAVGTGIVFWGFAVMNVLQTLYACTLLMDTKGKSLEEIQAMFETVVHLADATTHIADHGTGKGNGQQQTGENGQEHGSHCGQTEENGGTNMNHNADLTGVTPHQETNGVVNKAFESEVVTRL